jgi:hypothetical protein
MATAIAVVVGPIVACSSDSGSREAFCAEVVTVPSLETVLAGFAERDPQTRERRLGEAGAAYAELREASPDEIDGPVGQVVDLVEDLLETVTEHGDDPEVVADELRSSMGDHEGVQDAAIEVVAYAAEQCDVALDPAVGAVAPDGADDTEG